MTRTIGVGTGRTEWRAILKMGRLVRMARVYFGRRPHFGPYLRMRCPIRSGMTRTIGVGTGRKEWRVIRNSGREWVEAEVYPLIDSFGLPAETVLATFVEHVAMQIARHVRSGQVLVTGGGARNTFLLERMQAQFHIHGRTL